MAKSTLDLTFEDFKDWCLSLFAQTFTIGDSNYVNQNAYAKFGKQMLAEYQYTAEREQFLIKHTKIFFRGCLDRSQSHNTSTDFLEKLSNKIAELLSHYVMYKYEIPESGKSKNKLRIRVKEEIKKTLFDDNPYIAELKQRQAANREFRQKHKSERQKIIRERRYQEAAAAYKNARQVRGVFNEAQHTPIKR